MKKLLMITLGLAVALAPAMALEWMTDFAAAKAKAAAEGKAVLVDFTGSDWCGWCIRMKKDLFDKPAFEQYVADKFVLLEVDIPNNPKFDKAQLAANQALCEKYQVQGFPTVLVLTPEGEVAGGFSGYRATVEAAAKELDPALKVVRLLEEARKAEGEQRLKLLLEAYKTMPQEARESAVELRKEIATLDKEDASGVVREQKVREQMSALEREMRTAASPKEALEVVNKALSNCYEENRAELLRERFMLMLTSAETVEDVKTAGEAALEAARAIPGVTEDVLNQIKENFSRPELILERLKASHRR